MGSALAWSLACLVAASAVASASASLQQSLDAVPVYARDRPRSIRGFKSHALSTARGFGKRAEPPRPPPAAPAARDADDRPDDDDDYGDPGSVPVEWFVGEVRRDGALARLLVEQFVDADRDGRLAPDELLRPLLDRGRAPARLQRHRTDVL